MSSSSRQYIKIALNLIVAIIVILSLIFIVPKLLLFFMPFVIGYLIACIANPVVRWFEVKLNIRRKAITVFLIIFVLAAIILGGYGIGKILVDQIVGFMENLPSFWSSLERDLSAITEKLAGYFKFIPSEFEWDLVTLVNSGYLYFTDFIAKMTTPTVAAVGNFAKNLPSVLISVIMTLLSSYFFIAEREYLNKNVRAFFPLGVQKRWNMVFGNLKRAVGGYFKAQFKIELWIYLLLVIGLSLLEIKYAILIALGIACLDFLPVFGTGTVLIPWAIIKFLNADYKMAIWLLIIYAIGQLVRQIIQPKIVGDSIGVAPLPTLIFLFIGYKVAGVIGMILAVPVGIIFIKLYDEGVFDETKNSILLFFKRINNFRRLDEEDLKYLSDDQMEEGKGRNKP